MQLYDAHCHLQDPRLDGDHDAVLARAARAGVETLMCCATREADWAAVQALGQRPMVRASLGIHPWFAGDLRAGWLERLRDALGRQPAAIGEIGLDFAVASPSRERQLAVFLAQWRLSVELELPVSIHCRQAFGPLVECLEAEGPHPTGCMLHTYAGSAEMVERFARLNASFSFSGTITRPNHRKAPDVIRACPPERLLLESDAPDLPPYRPGKEEIERNEPAFLPYTLSRVAEVLGRDEAEIAALTSTNARRLFAAAEVPS